MNHNFNTKSYLHNTLNNVKENPGKIIFEIS